MSSEHPTCPNCGSKNVAEILYGLPIFDEDLERELNEKRTILGGCVVSDGDPEWRCNKCGHKWGSLKFGH